MIVVAGAALLAALVFLYIGSRFRRECPDSDEWWLYEDTTPGSPRPRFRRRSTRARAGPANQKTDGAPILGIGRH